MIVDIDDNSGFCFGVVNAITKAEESVTGGNKVFSLGDIVHNRVEVQRLEGLGLGSINHDELQGLRNATILIRAHGEPPATYKIARENVIGMIDATCPVVAKLQKKIRAAHKEMKAVDGQVLLLGKKGHAEVVGLTGQVNGDVTVIENTRDLITADFGKPIYFLSQTTQRLALFEQIAEEILKRADNPEKVIIEDTICRQVSNREPHLKEFASKYDAVLFVSGYKSSNGKVLFDVCREANPRSYRIEDETEINHEWFKGVERVGICGATSTPKWVMELVAHKIKSNL